MSPRTLQIVGQFDGQVYDANEPEGMVEVLLAGYERGALGPVTEEVLVGQLLPLAMSHRIAPQRSASLIQRATQLRRAAPGAASSLMLPASLQTMLRDGLQRLAGPTVAEVPISSRPRYTVQPVPRQAIAAGTTADIPVVSGIDQEPVFLVIGEDVAPLWSVNNIALSGDSLFANIGAIPATTMVPTLAGRAISLKRRTVKAGTPITINVTNKDGAAHNFEGALYTIGIDQARC